MLSPPEPGRRVAAGFRGPGWVCPVPVGRDGLVPVSPGIGMPARWRSSGVPGEHGRRSTSDVADGVWLPGAAGGLRPRGQLPREPGRRRSGPMMTRIAGDQPGRSSALAAGTDPAKVQQPVVGVGVEPAPGPPRTASGAPACSSNSDNDQPAVSLVQSTFVTNNSSAQRISVNARG